MRAAVTKENGSPDVVRVADIDRPAPSETELSIKVRATTVNRTDCAYRSGEPFPMRFFAGVRAPKAAVLGTEFAGVVEAAGSGVSDFAVGDRVCGYCEGTFGAHAEYMTIDESRLIARIPDGRTYAQAAPSMEGSHYALAFLRLVGIEAGQAVLVYGATGAIGSAAVQLAKRLGAMVTAVCGTAHVDIVRNLGADRVIDYQSEDFTQHDERYDLVLDAVGKTSFRASRPLLRPDGVFSVSERWLTIFLSLLGRLPGGPRVVFPFPRRDPEARRFRIDVVETGEYTPLIDRVYRFDDIEAAYRYVETGRKVGSVVIDVDNADAVG